MSDSPAEPQATLSSEPSCSGTWPLQEPSPSAYPSQMESDSSARSTREFAETTQELTPWWAKLSGQASIGRRPNHRQTMPWMPVLLKATSHSSSASVDDPSILVGPLKTAHDGYTHIFIAIDKFTKWIEVKPVSSTSAAKAVEFIKEITHRFGVPNQITTYLGSSFTGSEFLDFC